jgi:hypothetical protein
MAGGVSPIGAVPALAVALLLYHIRCSRKETHNENMANNKINEAIMKAEAIKARHRELLAVPQPTLQLESKPESLRTRKGDT